ncbi:hypothetical protein YC2023_029692 [Brassica napus]
MPDSPCTKSNMELKSLTIPTSLDLITITSWRLKNSVRRHKESTVNLETKAREDYNTFTKEQSTLREHLYTTQKKQPHLPFTQCEPKKLFGLCFGAIRTGNNLIFQFYPYRKKETESTIKAKDPPQVITSVLFAIASPFILRRRLSSLRY